MKRWNALALLVIAFSLLCGCSADASSAGKKGQSPPPMNVEVTAVIQRDVPIYGDWVSTMDGYVNANIQPQVSGYLIRQTTVKAQRFTQEMCCFRLTRARFRRYSIKPKVSLRKREARWRSPRRNTT